MVVRYVKYGTKSYLFTCTQPTVSQRSCVWKTDTPPQDEGGVYHVQGDSARLVRSARSLTWRFHRMANANAGIRGGVPHRVRLPPLVSLCGGGLYDEPSHSFRIRLATRISQKAASPPSAKPPKLGYDQVRQYRPKSYMPRLITCLTSRSYYMYLFTTGWLTLCHSVVYRRVPTLCSSLSNGLTPPPPRL